MPTPTVNLTALMLVTPILVPPSYTLSVDSSVLPVTIDADINTTRIELSIYNTTYVATAFTTANGKNIFTLSIPLIPTIQEATVQILGRNYNPNGVWADLTELPVGYTLSIPTGTCRWSLRQALRGSQSPRGTPRLAEPRQMAVVRHKSRGLTSAYWPLLRLSSSPYSFSKAILPFKLDRHQAFKHLRIKRTVRCNGQPHPSRVSLGCESCSALTQQVSILRSYSLAV